jgi:hypothetical protein
MFDSKKISISTIILAFSMFGIIGFVSSMLSYSPISKFISSGFIIFSYASIAVLSKRLSFKELFKVLMPLNIINIIKSYLETGYMMMKMRGILGSILDWANDYLWLGIDAVKQNKSLTMEFINQTKGKEFLDMTLKINSTANLIPNIPYSNEISNFLEGIPDWLSIFALIILIFYIMGEFIFMFLSNLFTIITWPIIFVMSAIFCLHFKVNIFYAYLIPCFWVPIAAVVDSFLRIYIFRFIFFRLLKNNPLISSYAKGIWE